MQDAVPGTIGPTLDVYSDYVCPFSRLAWPVLERVRAAVPLQVRLRAFELRPVPAPFADEGYVRALWARAQPIAEQLGVTLAGPGVQTRTRKAHEAVAYARTQGRADAMHAAVLCAYCEDGEDIGRIDVLVRLGSGIGLDQTGLRAALDGDAFTDEVLDDGAQAAELGISSVPAFVLDSAPAGAAIRTGWQDADSLLEWVRSNLMAERR